MSQGQKPGESKAEYVNTLQQGRAIVLACGPHRGHGSQLRAALFNERIGILF